MRYSRNQWVIYLCSQCVAYHASQKCGCLLKAACNNIQEISPNYFIPKPMKLSIHSPQDPPGMVIQNLARRKKHQKIPCVINFHFSWLFKSLDLGLKLQFNNSTGLSTVSCFTSSVFNFCFFHISPTHIPRCLQEMGPFWIYHINKLQWGKASSFWKCHTVQQLKGRFIE